MWPNRQETADLVTFTEEILNGKLHFLCSVRSNIFSLNEAKPELVISDLLVSNILVGLTLGLTTATINSINSSNT